MIKPMQEYDRYQRRVAKVMSKLEAALAAHRQWALSVKPRSEVRYMVGDLVYVEGRIKLGIRFIASAPEAKSTTTQKGAIE